MVYDPRFNKIEGWMSDGELLWLYEQATHCLTVAEIGVWKGRASHALASGCKNMIISTSAGKSSTKNGLLYCIDHFKGSKSELETTHKEAVKSNIKNQFIYNMRGFNNYRLIEGDSVSSAAKFSDKFFDMVFIDGDHDEEAVYNDIMAWKPKCRKILCGHDFSVNDSIHKALIKAKLNFTVQFSIWKHNILL